MDDWYRFTLDDGQSASLALADLTGGVDLAGGPVTLELRDPTGNFVAAGMVTEELAGVIHDFVDATTDGAADYYYTRVSGDVDVEYSLVVTRGADFDSEPNNGPGNEAQDITPTGTVLGTTASAFTFAVISDYGVANLDEEHVADMVKGWEPEFIINAGDNTQGGWGMTVGDYVYFVGPYYGDYILGRSDDLFPEQTSPTQRFFPTMGNHDGRPSYLDYFHNDPLGNDPLSARLPSGVHNVENSYYDFRYGPVHFFCLDSEAAVLSPASQAAQQEWLQQGLADSTATWKVVYFHRPPYTSSSHPDATAMRWPFQEWGVDVVFSGHNHVYERVLVEGVTYITCGTGGGYLYGFYDTEPGSLVRYNDDFGAMRVTVEATSAMFEFLSVDDGAHGANGGQVIDSFTLAQSPTKTSEPLLESPFFDCYGVEANPGDLLSIETYTPGDGPGQFVNEFDPAIDLYDPAGTLVASDDNAAADGRNALLVYRVASDGPHTVRVRPSGAVGGEYFLSVERLDSPAVFGRHVFCNNSFWDTATDQHPELDDDTAIAADKEALRPGMGRATLANYTNYDRGINGIMIDVAGLPPVEGPIDPADYFAFKTGNDDDPAGWDAYLAVPAVNVRPGEGVGHSDRITLIWPDYDPESPETSAVAGQWLEVTVLANEHTGLAALDVFYFGNAIGETGDSTTHARVDASDILQTRNHPHPFFSPAEMDSAYDFDRDGRVDTRDILIARKHQTAFFDELRRISVRLIGTRGAMSQKSSMPAAGRSTLFHSVPSRPLLLCPETDAGAQAATTVGRVSAHDTVFERAGRRRSGGATPSPNTVDWLWELETPLTSQRPPTKRQTPRGHPSAADELDRMMAQ